MLDERRLLAVVEATRKPEPRHLALLSPLGDGFGFVLARLGRRGRAVSRSAAGAASGAAAGAAARGAAAAAEAPTWSRFGCVLMPVTESLNSRIPTPSERPISGSRFAPKSSRARIKRKIR